MCKASKDDTVDKTRRTSAQIAEIKSIVEKIVKFKTMSRDEGFVMVKKKKYLRLMDEEGYSKSKALKKWRKLANGSHTEGSGKDLRVPYEKDPEYNTKEGVEQKREIKGKKGETCTSENMKNSAGTLEFFEAAAPEGQSGRAQRHAGW